MLLPRTSVRSALLILLLLLFILLQTPGRCQAAARHRGSAPQPEARRGRHSQAQLVARYRRGPVEFSGHEAAGPKRKGRSNHEGRLGDSKHKEKFITHLTGPLYFKPQCRKQFHRLYNNTRDCTVPACGRSVQGGRAARLVYKRCARLLTQLAKSPRCAER